MATHQEAYIIFLFEQLHFLSTHSLYLFVCVGVGGAAEGGGVVSLTIWLSVLKIAYVHCFSF